MSGWRWQKSSFSMQVNCVEVAEDTHGHILVRDSKQVGDHSYATLVFTREEWDSFLAGVKAGEFDKSLSLPGSCAPAGEKLTD